MNRTINKQAGNVIEWIILGIVLIGVVGLIAWQYMNADKAQNDADLAASNTHGSTSQKLKEGTYSLPKWSVFADLPDALKDDAKDVSVEYYKDPTTTADAYYFVSKTLKDADFLCPKNDSLESNGGFLVVQRSPNEPSQPVVATKVGDHYYWVMKTLQNVCYKDELMTKYFGPYAPAMQSTIRTKAQN